MQPDPIWAPSGKLAESANIEDFRQWLGARHGLDFSEYSSLHSWSVDRPEEFWGLLWDYFDIRGERGEGRVLAGEAMPGARWYPGARLNYVDQVLRHVDQDTPALIDESEPGGPPTRFVSWRELRRQVAAFAATLRELGVGRGDRVVGYLPNISEAVVAFLAAAGLGAVWAACGQDYAATSAIDRLGQLDPVVLVTADGYRYGGKAHDRRGVINDLRRGLSSLRCTVVVPRLGLSPAPLGEVMTWKRATRGNPTFQPEAVDFDHPLWLLFSSGTTGKPKGIVHGHGGVLLEHLKQMCFHLNLSEGDNYFWYTSPSWMMWNFQVAGLLVGATIVCYDGSPGYPAADAMWAMAARRGVTVLGTSPAYLQACEKARVSPSAGYNLTRLRILGVTGSVLPASSYAWVARHIGSGVAVASMSGGTDIVSAFAGSVPTMPIWAGELSGPCLGVALDAWDSSGNSVRDEVGELVVTRPLPSMPLRFWNDPGDRRYQASYFDVYPGVWRHGDWITITSRGTIVIHGRSDSTLNRNGVRMGSADIYHVVEKLPEIHESLVIGVEYPDGSYWMPLFVVVADGSELNEELRLRIRTAIRLDVSAKHVPDDIIAVPGIPHTRTGKKLEIPIKRLLQGAGIVEVADRESVDDPSLLDFYARIARDYATADTAAQRNLPPG